MGAKYGDCVMGGILVPTVKSIRCLSVSTIRQSEESNENDGEEEQTRVNPRPDHSLETSRRYLASKAYSDVYGDEPVWTKYRRNFKGQWAPQKTRKTCIRADKMSGNPCPICRDEYLVLHPANVDLLKQFIDPYSGEVQSYQKTGVCQKQHKKLSVVIEQAYDFGYLDMPVKPRQYNYVEYYPQLKQSKNQS